MAELVDTTLLTDLLALGVASVGGGICLPFLSLLVGYVIDAVRNVLGH